MNKIYRFIGESCTNALHSVTEGEEYYDNISESYYNFLYLGNDTWGLIGIGIKDKYDYFLGIFSSFYKNAPRSKWL